MDKAAKLFLIDDHAVVRNGLKSLIERLGDYQVIDEFDHGQQLMQAFPFKTQPNLIIMDLMMPVMDGTATMKALKEKEIDVPVLMLTLETDESKIINLFRLGIRGYIPKSASADILKKAIDDVLFTGYYHDEMMVKALRGGADSVIGETERIIAQVTERERTFLELVCDEAEPTYEQIADQMGVSRRTVDGYRESLFRKFSVKSKAGLVVFAIKYGLVSL